MNLTVMARRPWLAKYTLFTEPGNSIANQPITEGICSLSGEESSDSTYSRSRFLAVLARRKADRRELEDGNTHLHNSRFNCTRVHRYTDISHSPYPKRIVIRNPVLGALNVALLRAYSPMLGTRSDWQI